MLFFYIRHGEPIYNPDSLTEQGHKQAEALAKRLALFGVDKIFSSSSRRAIQTAEPTCNSLGKEMTLCDWAHENLAWKELAVSLTNGVRTWCYDVDSIVANFRSPEVMALGKEWYKHPCFAEYTFEKGMKRIDEAADAFFLELGYRHDRERNRYEIVKPSSERVALFAHQGFGMAFLSSVLDIPYPIFSVNFDMSHSGMTVINFAERGGYVYPQVLQLSNDSHLYKENIITGYHNRIKF